MTLPACHDTRRWLLGMCPVVSPTPKWRKFVTRSGSISSIFISECVCEHKMTRGKLAMLSAGLVIGCCSPNAGTYHRELQEKSRGVGVWESLFCLVISIVGFTHQFPHRWNTLVQYQQVCARFTPALIHYWLTCWKCCHVLPISARHPFQLNNVELPASFSCRSWLWPSNREAWYFRNWSSTATILDSTNVSNHI